MKTFNELSEVLKYSRKYNIWSNPKRPNDTQIGCCEYCGKKVGKNPLYVHVTYRGTCIPSDISENEINEVEESQGCWAIGSECAKNLFGEDIDKYTTKG